MTTKIEWHLLNSPFYGNFFLINKNEEIISNQKREKMRQWKSLNTCERFYYKSTSEYVNSAKTSQKGDCVCETELFRYLEEEGWMNLEYAQI